ncbi:hypothetical protein COV61_00875 [Candidatus Micrarchaeota archaeon CG11_big_fil_rev_8_21_14_0_20_47_5]|nr:MAG: hypothetical protein COV61_00875 [Candidatus Micrarchaeota archaeon CG11_big_fil_rev_8_21_14_0_20_47_5]
MTTSAAVTVKQVVLLPVISAVSVYVPAVSRVWQVEMSPGVLAKRAGESKRDRRKKRNRCLVFFAKPIAHSASLNKAGLNLPLTSLARTLLMSGKDLKRKGEFSLGGGYLKSHL